MGTSRVATFFVLHTTKMFCVPLKYSELASILVHSMNWHAMAIQKCMYRTSSLFFFFFPPLSLKYLNRDLNRYTTCGLLDPLLHTGRGLFLFYPSFLVLFRFLWLLGSTLLI